MNTTLSTRARISRHYAWALTTAFARASTTHVIIFEDDLALAPDAIEYLYSTLSILTSAKRGSVVAAAAWNDNGQADKVPEEATLTSFFPGLGWVLSRALWDVLSPHWPASVFVEDPAPVIIGWDYWLRTQFLANDWQTIVPTTSRTRHTSVGTNVDQIQNLKLYSSTVLSDTPSGALDWKAITVALTDVETFAAKVQESLSTGTIINTIEDVLHLNGSSNIPLMPYHREDYINTASRLALWPTPRGHFHHTLRVTVPNTNVTILLYDEVRASAFFDLPSRGSSVAHTPQITSVKADLNESCDTACEARGLECIPHALDKMNECATLTSFFGKSMCRECAFETGGDLPAAVDIGAPIETAGLCLVTEMGVGLNGKLDCAGRFLWTRRACGCVGHEHNTNRHDEL